MSKKEFDYTNQLRFKQIMLEQQLKLKKLIAERELTESKDNISQDVDLKSIKGIGDKTLNTLISNGITSVDKLKNNLEKLQSYGISPIAIVQIKNHFKEAN